MYPGGWDGGAVGAQVTVGEALGHVSGGVRRVRLAPDQSLAQIPGRVPLGLPWRLGQIGHWLRRLGSGQKRFPVPRRPHAPLAEVSPQFPNVRQHVFHNVTLVESHRRGLRLES
jgi:hypothetical protein